MAWVRIRKAIDELLKSDRQILVAIDGRCTSGKSTLAEKLQQVYDCNLFHMDDFFLQPHQRTAERFAEVGGNVDYERFAVEVLQKLKKGESFSYRPFSCQSFMLLEPIRIEPKKLNIIEGTYSHHTYFHEPYDLKIFLTVDTQVQRDRVLQRPEFLHKRFFEEWIPMEESYFKGFGIAEKAEIVVENLQIL